jgi:hypothetical protein
MKRMEDRLEASITNKFDTHFLYAAQKHGIVKESYMMLLASKSSTNFA